MRWELTSNNSDNETYHLFKDEKKILSLVLHSFSHSARIECDNEKRVFLVRKEGLLRNKIVIRNEYGIKVGELGQENKEQFIQVNNEKFFFSIHDDPMAEMILYKESIDKPFVTCGLNINKGKTDLYFAKGKPAEKVSHPELLMALCWYMFLPLVKENVAEYAG